MSDDEKLSANGHRAPSEDRTPDSELLASTLEMTNAIGEIRSALEILQRHIGVLVARSSERHDLNGSTRDLGELLLGASQAAEAQRAEIESDRAKILASAEQIAAAIISDAEARAREIVGDAASVPSYEESRTQTMPRVDATLIMPKTTATAAVTDSTAATPSVLVADAAGSADDTPPVMAEKEPRLDPTLAMPKVTPPKDPGQPSDPPTAARPSRAADLLATLNQIIEANASLADDIAAVADH